MAWGGDFGHVAHFLGVVTEKIEKQQKSRKIAKSLFREFLLIGQEKNGFYATLKVKNLFAFLAHKTIVDYDSRWFSA